MRLRSGAAQGKGAGPPHRRLTDPPPSCFSAAERSLCSGRPPPPPSRLSPVGPEAARAPGGGGGGRGAGRPGECAGSGREAAAGAVRRPVRGRGAGAARGVLPLPPFHRQLRLDWQSRTALADWPAPGEAGEASCALIGYRGSGPGRGQETEPFPRAARGWGRGGDGRSQPGRSEACAGPGLAERRDPRAATGAGAALTAGGQGRAQRPSRGLPGQAAAAGPICRALTRGFAALE